MQNSHQIGNIAPLLSVSTLSRSEVMQYGNLLICLVRILLYMGKNMAAKTNEEVINRDRAIQAMLLRIRGELVETGDLIRETEVLLRSYFSQYN